MIRSFFSPTGILAFLTLFTVSCTNSQKGSESFTINGKFAGCNGGNLLLEEMDINAIVPLDSSAIDPSGNVLFTRNASQAGFYFLKFPDKKKIILLLDKGENLEISGDCRNLSTNLVIKGSTGSLLLADFFRTTNMNRRSVDSLKALIHEHEGDADFLQVSMNADAAFRQIAEIQRKEELTFLKKNPNSLACLIVLNYSFGPRPILDIDHDFNVYKAVDSCLQRVYPQNKHVIYHHKRVMEKERQETVRNLKETNPDRKPR